MECGGFLEFGDVSQETELYDEWLFSSTRCYDYVNMYETEKSTQAASWFERLDSLCKLPITASLVWYVLCRMSGVRYHLNWS